MACPAISGFKHVSNIGDTRLMNALEVNLKVFTDWALLRIGAFYNVVLPTSGWYGGDFSVLKPVHEKTFTDGQIWQGIRKDWVWESGVNYSLGSPVRITGVIINNTGYPSGHATYGHYVDYPRGRVVFNSGISTNSTVRMSYSYRYAQVFIADNAPWLKEIQYRSFRPDDSQWGVLNSGTWNMPVDSRIQLPAIVIEAVPRRTSTPYEIGAASLNVYQDVLFHVLAENRWDRNQLIDILADQKDFSLELFDVMRAINSGVLPLNQDGSLINPSTNYITLCSGYRWNSCRFTETYTSEVETIHPTLHAGIVRLTCHVVTVDS